MKRGAAFIAIASIAALAGCAHARPAVEAGASRGAHGAVPQPLVYFATGNSSVTGSELAKISENSAWLAQNEGARVVLAGHCDERGGDRMNMELGDRRARAVKAALIAGGAGDEERMVVVSFGKRRPADSSRGERAWRKNRRVEFIMH